MSINDLFQDCEQIANKYEVKLIDVVYKFSCIEEGYKREMTYVPYDNLLNETSNYFKKNYEKLNGDEKND